MLFGPSTGTARIERLRSLIARLEQSAPSRRRDAVLRAVRERIVTLDTGSHNSSAWRSNPDDRPDSLALLDN
jgi:sigma54-dependent transcription regulator